MPSKYGQVVDGQERVIPQPMIAWATRKDHALWAEGHSASEIVQYAEQVGVLAIDVADYVADCRLRIVEALEFDEGGVYLRAFQNPIPYWVRRGDLSAETLALLNAMSISWIEADASAHDPDAGT